MAYQPVTSFRRPIDAAQLAAQKTVSTPLPSQGVNKWETLRELAAARVRFGLSDRDMTVLQALVSFHPATILGGNQDDLVVHPSNASICERLNGMADSTMRRHLAHLVDAGIIIRRDSPNGKRYARRHGDEKVAFGFDLTPLAHRFMEFCQAAESVRAEESRLKRLRETVSLMRRDLAGLAEYGAEERPDISLWSRLTAMANDISKYLRRKLTIDALEALQVALESALNQARDIIDPVETEIMSTNDVSFEQHYQNSNTYSYDLEPSIENAQRREAGFESEAEVQETGDTDFSLDNRKLPNIPLGLVLAACPEIKTYCDGTIRHWHELVRAVDIVRPMMGISPSAWDEAKMAMGPEEASVVVAAMLENFATIHSPGGYLRTLTSKAEMGAFSCGPMIMALMRKEAA